MPANVMTTVQVKYGKVARHSPEKWYVLSTSSPSPGYPVDEFNKKKPAVKKARKLAKKTSPSKLKVWNKKGSKTTEKTWYD